MELDAAAVEDLRSAVSRVDAQGLEVRIAPSVEDTATAGETFDFGLVGQDRPGIVRQVTAVLTGLDANIETFRTWITEGPETGAPLFNVEARLRLPPGPERAEGSGGPGGHFGRDHGRHIALPRHARDADATMFLAGDPEVRRRRGYDRASSYQPSSLCEPRRTKRRVSSSGFS